MRRLRKLDDDPLLLSQGFNQETDLFLSDLISEENLQSTIDLVTDGPPCRQFTVFTMVTDQSSIDRLGRSLLVSKNKEKKLIIAALRMAQDNEVSEKALEALRS